MKSKCVFFDRDGIVNLSPGAGYVERWEDFRLQPGFPDVLRAVAAAGYEAIVVSNQRGVALGRMTEAAVREIHRLLQETLRREHGLAFLDILCCPHERDACDCRKPKPGMLLTAAARHDIDLEASWMVGDQESDIEAGRRAGCRAILVSEAQEPTAAEYHVRDLTELRRLLEKVLS